MALRARSPHSKAMMRKPEPKFVRHLILKLFYLCRNELDHLSALRADHMVVMFMLEMMLVIGLVIAKPHLTSKPGFSQEF